LSVRTWSTRLPHSASLGEHDGFCDGDVAGAYNPKGRIVFETMTNLWASRTSLLFIYPSMVISHSVLVPNTAAHCE
jgi:hypothetical protein